MNFREQFYAARRVSTPLISVTTFDAQSTIRQVLRVDGINAETTPLISWDAVNGLRGLNQNGMQELGSIGALDNPITANLVEALRMCQGCSGDAIIFIYNAHLFWSDPVSIQAVWNLRDTFKSTGNMAVMLCGAGAQLPGELAHDVYAMDDPLPTAEQLREIIRQAHTDAGIEATAETLESATDALVGIPTFPAEQSAAMSLRNRAMHVSELWERKKAIIAKTPGLSVWEGPESLESLGGLHNIKAYITRLMEGRDAPKLILWMDEMEKAFAGTGTDMSGVKTELTMKMLEWTENKAIDGLLLYGVPGAAKSAICKGAGKRYGRLVIPFDLAGMQSGIVGSSGTNLRTAQKTVDAIAAGNKVLMIATCNSVSALPGELLSRFKLGTFFFDVPTEEERAAIWAIYRAQYEIPETESLPSCDGWTGREIRECCYKAWRLGMSLVEASGYVVPVIKSNPEQIESIRRGASGKYISASHPGLYHYSGPDMLSPKAFPAVSDARRIRELN